MSKLRNSNEYTATAALLLYTWQDPSHLATSPQLPTLKARHTWELNELFSSMLLDGGVQKIVNKIRSCGWRLQIAGSITKRVCMRWLCWLEWPWPSYTLEAMSDTIETSNRDQVQLHLTPAHLMVLFAMPWYYVNQMYFISFSFLHLENN